MSIDVNKAHSHHNISIRMLKIYDSAIVESLTIIFNSCINQSMFPDICKKSNICPIHKKVTYKLLIITDYCHYYQFVGIFNSLYKYLEDSKLLSVHQSDFGSSDSCVNQLLSVVHKLFEAFHAYPHLETCVVFHDMFKAFDKVWHQGLIFKLKSVRVSDSLLCLLESFLSNRFQRVLLMARHLTGYQLRLVCH